MKRRLFFFFYIKYPPQVRITWNKYLHLHFDRVPITPWGPVNKYGYHINSNKTIWPCPAAASRASPSGPFHYFRLFRPCAAPSSCWAHPTSRCTCRLPVPGRLPSRRSCLLCCRFSARVSGSLWRDSPRFLARGRRWGPLLR